MEARTTETSNQEAVVYREYLHLVRTTERSKIVNALWHFT